MDGRLCEVSCPQLWFAASRAVRTPSIIDVDLRFNAAVLPAGPTTLTIFGDQNFKSAIALIELHKVRFGTYPDNLADIRFTGPWDQIWMSAVKYSKLEEGYQLDLVRGWVGTPDMEYPVSARGITCSRQCCVTRGPAETYQVY